MRARFIAVSNTLLGRVKIRGIENMRLILILVALIVIAIPALAETRSENVDGCNLVSGDPGDLDKQIKACTALIESGRETQNDLASAYSNRGQAYGRKGLYNSAIADFNKALTLVSNDPLTYNNLAIAYKLKGQRDRAIANFRKALSLGLTSPYKESAQQNIKLLGSTR